MKRGILIAASAAALALSAHASGAAPSASLTTPEANVGKQLFEERCAMCHGVRGMGTHILARRLPAEQAPLEARDDLTSDYVIMAARTGVGNMPRVQRGEVSDAEMKLIADYLSRGKAE